MLCTSDFVDDVMSSYNGSNRSESKTKRVSATSPNGGTSVLSDNVVWSRSPCGGTRSEVCPSPTASRLCSPILSRILDCYVLLMGRRHFISVCNQPLRSTQPSWDGKMSTSQRAVRLCGWGVKAGMK